MSPIDHVFLLPILQFIISSPVSSPAMNNETCRVHNTYPLHPSPQWPHCYTPITKFSQCIEQCDSQLPQSRCITPTLSAACLEQTPFHNNKQLIYTPSIVFPRLRNIRVWQRTTHLQQSRETFSYFSSRLLCRLYNPTYYSWLFTQSKSHNSSTSSALKGQLFSSIVYILHLSPWCS